MRLDVLRDQTLLTRMVLVDVKGLGATTYSTVRQYFQVMGERLRSTAEEDAGTFSNLLQYLHTVSRACGEMHVW